MLFAEHLAVEEERSLQVRFRLIRETEPRVNRADDLPQRGLDLRLILQPIVEARRKAIEAVLEPCSSFPSAESGWAAASMSSSSVTTAFDLAASARAWLAAESASAAFSWANCRWASARCTFGRDQPITDRQPNHKQKQRGDGRRRHEQCRLVAAGEFAEPIAG